MLRARVIIAISLLFVSPLSLACKSLQSFRVQKIIEYLQQDSQFLPTWHNFDATKVPLIVIDNYVSNTCAFIIKDATLIESVNLGSNFPSESYGYSFIVDPNLKPNYPGYKNSEYERKNGIMPCCGTIRPIANSLVNILRKQKWTAAFVQWFPKYPIAVAPGPGVDAYFAGVFATLVHEKFHFFYQNRGLSNQPWPNPSLNSGVPNTFLFKQCWAYSEEALELLIREDEALFDALEHLSDKTYRQYLSKFLQYRQERYQKAPPFPQTGLKPLPGFENCEKLEAYFETFEGVAHFNGYAASLRQNLLNYEDFAQMAKRSLPKEAQAPEKISPTLYYYTGSIQWLLLQSQLPAEDFNSLTSRYTKAGMPQPLHQLIKEILM